ncbi:hypothetical protein C8Q78DRAFT_1076685 [Trametes maxima]|nr:hypothetical protein C8Q78DRAFT_1076685 [Trametes maxima]
MAFAQFYYDPALEFEKMLEDDGSGPTPAHPGSIVSPPGIAGVAGPSVPADAGAQVPAGAAAKGCSAGAITRAASIAVGETHASQGMASRWFGEGLLKRRASTGSVHGGSHPGVPK